MRGFCNKILKDKKISFDIKQTNYSYNKKSLHYVAFTSNYHFFSEKNYKLCKGKILLVIVNIDKKSKNYLKHLKFILSENLNRSVLISENCATAFLTLEPETIVFYYMSSYYKKNKGNGIRYNDPKLKINWPNKPKIISSRDINFKNIK